MEAALLPNAANFPRGLRSVSIDVKSFKLISEDSDDDENTDTLESLSIA